MIQPIASLQNEKIKNLVRLIEKSRERRTQQLFTIEGAREISLAMAAGYEIETVFCCPELLAASDYPDLLASFPENAVVAIAPQVFARIACRSESDGVVAVARAADLCLSALSLPDNPFIIVVESVEKPGNLGAILRTADAAAVDALIVCDPLADVYNPNVVRSSIGCVFTVQVAAATAAETIDFLRRKGIRTFAAELTAASFYHETDFTRPSAIVMGTEADGLSAEWIAAADERIKIPMRGKIDSLNVSVATAVIAFEAMRQRQF